MDIEKINDEEHKLVIEAKFRYGDYYQLAKELTYYSNNVIKSYYDNNIIVCMLYAPISKFLSLTLLSIIRKHGYQHSLNLRTAIDYLTLTLYSMGNPEFKNFGIQIDEKHFLHKDKVVDKAYFWLKEKYGSALESFETLRESINDTFAHPNINNAVLNIEIREDMSTATHIFDRVTDITTEMTIMGYCSIMLNIYELIHLVASDYPNVIILCDNYENDLANFIDRYLVLQDKMYEQRREDIAKGKANLHLYKKRKSLKGKNK